MDPATINAIRQQAGAAPLTNGAPTVSAWDSIAKRITPAEPSYGQRVTAEATQGGNDTLNAFQEGGADIQKNFKDLTDNAGSNPAIEALRALVFAGHTAGDIAGTALKAGMGGLKTALAPVTEIKDVDNKTVGQHVSEDIIQPIVQKAVTAANTKSLPLNLGPNVSAAPSSLKDVWDSLTPDVQKGVIDVLNTTGLLGGGATTLGETFNATKNAAVGAKDFVADTAQTAKNTAVSSFDEVKNAQPLAKLRGVANTKVQDSINKEVDGLLTATRGINNKVQLAGQKGADLKATLSDPTVFKGIQVKNGKIVPDEAITTIEDRIGKVMDAKHEMLPEIDRLVPEVPRETIRQRAVADITGQFPPADEAALIERINKQVDALPETMKPSEIDALRAKFRTAARDAKGIQKSSSEYAALENAARDTVFDITDKLPVSGAEEYKALNDYVKNMITTKDFLDKTLRNQVVKGGRLGGYSLKLIGAIAGTSHGPIGAIIGSEVGGAISDIIVNNQLGSSIKLRLIKNMTDDPEIIAQAEQLLKDVKDLNVPQLPAPTSDFRTVKKDGALVQLPARSQTTIDAADAARRSPK